jgi:hypothetical protein
MTRTRTIVAAAAAILALAAPASAATTYTLAPHCAGLTFDTSGWPADSYIQISTKRPNYNYTVRVSHTFTDSTHEKIGFGDTTGGNHYQIQVYAPGVAPLVLAGFQNPCTRRNYNQVPTPAPYGWVASGGFTG